MSTSNDKFNFDKDTFKSYSRVLYPGRFYVLKYKANTKKVYNSRPVIISLGIDTKDDLDNFVCIDLCTMPYKVRVRFVEMFWSMFKSRIDNDILKTLEGGYNENTYFKEFSYGNIMKYSAFKPIKNSIKKYKIENTYEIYSVPYINVKKLIGDFCDEDNIVNGRLIDIQSEFLKKSGK